MNRSKILIVPVDPAPGELLGRMQWALLKAFHRPAVILEEFVASPGAAAWADVEGRVQGALLQLKGRPLDNAAVVVVLTQNGLDNGAIGQARESPIAAPVIHCPLEGFREPACAIRAIVHTLGHFWGLSCCHGSGCVMNHWDCCVREDRPFLDPRFCGECARTLAQGMGAQPPESGEPL